MRVVGESAFVLLSAMTAAVLVCTSGALAQLPVAFTIDPAQSNIALSGNAAGMPLEEQSAGSLTTSYSGTINALWLPGSIQFTGAIADANISGTYQPGFGGVAGSAPGDYGAQADAGDLGTAYGAVRTFVFSLSSGLITIVGSSFDATQVNLNTTSGDFDYVAPTAGSGSLSLIGNSGPNQAGSGSLVLSGPNATLTIPISFTQIFDLINPGDSELAVNGQLVATGVIPEPMSLLLLLAGAGLLAIRRRSS